jgi:hypothetical protein
MTVQKCVENLNYFLKNSVIFVQSMFMVKFYNRISSFLKSRILISILLIPVLYLVNPQQSTAQTINLEVEVLSATIISAGLYGTNCGDNDCGGFNQPDPRMYLQIRHSSTATWTGNWSQERDGLSCSNWAGLTGSPGNYAANGINSASTILLQIYAFEPDNALSGSADADCGGFGAPAAGQTM